MCLTFRCCISLSYRWTTVPGSRVEPSTSFPAQIKNILHSRQTLIWSCSNWPTRNILTKSETEISGLKLFELNLPRQGISRVKVVTYERSFKTEFEVICALQHLLRHPRQSYAIYLCLLFDRSFISISNLEISGLKVEYILKREKPHGQLFNDSGSISLRSLLLNHYKSTRVE